MPFLTESSVLAKPICRRCFDELQRVGRKHRIYAVQGVEVGSYFIKESKGKSFVRERWLTAPQSSYSTAYFLLFSHKLNGGLYADLDDKIVGTVLRKAKGTEIIDQSFNSVPTPVSSATVGSAGEEFVLKRVGIHKLTIYHLFERVTLKIMVSKLSFCVLSKLECVFFEIACFDRFCRFGE